MAESVRDDINIQATAHEILDVALDFEMYPDWNANVKEAHIEETDGEGRGALVFYRVDAKFREISYTLEYDYSELPGAFSWRLAEGEIEELSGSYSFDEFEDVTEVVYKVRIEPGFPVPGMIKRQAEKQIASSALRELRRRVESA